MLPTAGRAAWEHINQVQALPAAPYAGLESTCLALALWTSGTAPFVQLARINLAAV